MDFFAVAFLVVLVGAVWYVAKSNSEKKKRAAAYPVDKDNPRKHTDK